MKKFLIFLFTALMLLSVVVLPVGAISEINSENDSYLFDENKHTIDAPEPYFLSRTITGETFGIDDFVRIEDVETAADGSIFISDSDLHAVYRITPDGATSVLTEFNDGINNIVLKKPMGLFASDNGELYVADREARFVYIFDWDFNYKGRIDPPKQEELFSQNLYEPLKVCADTGGRVYVISANQTQGMLQFSKEGKFLGFLGAIRVSPSFTDLLLRALGTEKQKKTILQLIPTEYNSLDIDDDSFIYGTISAIDTNKLRSEVDSKTGQAAPIMRINPKGEDVLLRQGRFSPVGDVNFLSYEAGKRRNGDEIVDSPNIVDVTCSKNGIYAMLDDKRGRIYIYNNIGELLFVFGGISENDDEFVNPIAVTYRDDNLVVADKDGKAVKIFQPTNYAKKVYTAIEYHELGLYDEETEIWKEVEREYIGSELAYLGIGRAEYSKGNYLEAMRNFEKAENKEYYSKAFKKYRKELGSKYIGWLVVGLSVCIALGYLVNRIYKKNKKSEYDLNEPITLLQKVFYGKNVALHPFKSFYELKVRGIGTVGSASAILVAVVFFTLIQKATEPYLFTAQVKQNILIQGFLSIVMLVGLFCISNWCFTSLMDGKGTMKDIYIYTCYSLVPLLVSTPLVTVISQFSSLDEVVLCSFISNIATFLVVFLIFIGTLVVHDYSLGKTIAMLLLTVIGMLILVFIALLCITLFQQIIIFVTNIVGEIKLR